VTAIRRVCIYCGSNTGTRPAYTAAAARLGVALGEQGLSLVYGGGNVGLMGVLADAALAAGVDVIGVIPEALEAKELAHPRLTELRVVASMHERKALMAELADGFIAMPGGLGTLDELFETWTWAQLGFHGKPCGLLDVEEYFQPLIAFLDHAVLEGFVRAEHRRMTFVETDPLVLLDRFRSWKPSPIGKWLERSTL